MSRFSWATLLAPAILGLAVRASAITSTFDTDLDGWSATSGVSWVPSYVEFQDTGPADGGQLVAPNTFHGDWVSQYGFTGAFSLDYAVFHASAEPFPSWIKISGPGGSIGASLPVATQPSGWMSFSFGLSPGNWDLLSGTFEGTLANVTEVRIFMAAGSLADEITGVDNVSVVPEPATLVTLGLAAAVVVRRKRSA